MVGQLDGLDELAARLQASRVDELHQQSQQIPLVDAGGLDVGRLGRNAIRKASSALLDRPQINQVIAQPPAIARLALQRRGHIPSVHQTRDQQISQSHSAADDCLPGSAHLGC